VYEAALMEPAESPCDADRQAKKVSYVHRRTKQPLKRLTAWILEHQRRPAAFAPKLQRLHRPCIVKMIPQPIFMCEAIEGGGRRVFCNGSQYKYGAAAVISVRTPLPTKDAFAVLPQNEEIAAAIKAKFRQCLQ
jgi:hypothetical protein